MTTTKTGWNLHFIVALFMLVSFLLSTVAGCTSPDKTSAVSPGSNSTKPSSTTAPTSTNRPPVDLTVVEVIESSSQDITAAGGIVSLGNDITVAVQPGSSGAPEKITINKLDTNSLSNVTGLSQNAALGLISSYEVNIGNQHEFSQPITIQVPYDPARVVSDYPPEKALLAAWWDTEQNLWHVVPVEVDTQKNLITFTTDHLTVWTWMWIKRGYKISESEHFITVYDPGATIYIKPEEGVKATGEQDVEAFAGRLSTYLESAYDAYIAAGYADPRLTGAHVFEAMSMPTQQIPGTDVSVLSMPHAKIYVFIWTGTAESETGNLAGNISMAHNYDSADRVKHEAAHELFHAVEQRYFTVFGYGARRWWLEASADYAADRIAWSGLNSMDTVPLKYFASPLNTIDSHHEYQTARFIDYLVKKGIDFKGLFEAVAAGYTQILGSLDAHVNAKTSKMLVDHYRDWTAYMLFDASSPLDTGQPTPYIDLLQSSIAQGPQVLGASQTEQTATLKLKGNYTAALWGFKVEPKDAKAADRSVRVEVTGALPSDVTLGVYTLKGNQRVKGGATLKGTISAATGKGLNTAVAGDEVVYIVAANGGARDQDLSVKVSDAAAELKASFEGTIDFTNWAFGSSTNPLTVRLLGALGGDASLKFEGAEHYTSYGKWPDVLAFVFSISSTAVNDSLDFNSINFEVQPAQDVVKMVGTEEWRAYSGQTIDITNTWKENSGGKWSGAGFSEWDGSPISGSGLVTVDPERDGQGLSESAAHGAVFYLNADYDSLTEYRDLQTGSIDVSRSKAIESAPTVVIRLVRR